MKKILALVKDHFHQDFQLSYYLTLTVFLAVSLIINYSVDLENSLIDTRPTNAIRIASYFSLYSFAYYGTCLLVSYFKNINEFWKSKKFWLFSVFGLSILSFDKGLSFVSIILSSFNQPYGVYTWLFKIATSASSFLVVLLPLFIFYKLIDEEKSEFYGLTKPGDIKPYLKLLLIVAPIIFIAAFQTGFNKYYPIYKTNSVSELWAWPSYLPMILFEFIYGADFLNVEILFRGFFVIGVAQIMGKHSVMPMVAIYCCLHFGKPAGEAISSIVGGYIIGIIAFYTRSIPDGIVIHIGIAWLMEAAAYLTKQF